MQVEHSYDIRHRHRSLSPGNIFPDSSIKLGRHVHFSESGPKSGRSNVSSSRGHAENYSQKSSFLVNNGYQSPSKSNVFNSSRNSDLSFEDSPRNKTYNNSRFKMTSGSTSPDSGVASGGSDSKASEPSSTKSESNTPRYKFHSSRHSPDSGLLLGDFKKDHKPKERNADFSFAAKSSVLADEVGDSLENSKLRPKKPKPESTTNHSRAEITKDAFHLKREQPASRYRLINNKVSFFLNRIYMYKESFCFSKKRLTTLSKPIARSLIFRSFFS